MTIMQLSCPKCGYEIEKDIEIADTCIGCGNIWTPLYPPATVAMTNLGHLLIWKGFRSMQECAESEPDLTIQHDVDVVVILASLSQSEREDIAEGWQAHTNLFNPEYFQVSNG